MVLSLQLATGQIRKYQTFYSGLGEIPSYRTKCGKFWHGRPDLEAECDHLDCALKATETKITHTILFISCEFFVMFLGSSHEMIFDNILFILLVSFNGMILVFIVWVFYNSLRNKWQLDEYRDKGTIGGVRAWKHACGFGENTS
jgi:hypothetical protein